MASATSTPQRQLTLSAELRKVIDERHIFTTKTRMKVLSALDNITEDSSQDKGKSLRSHAIQEILTSEVSYLHQLEVIMKFFMDPLKEKSFISHSTFMTLFGHIETLYNVHGELLHELKLNPENIAAPFIKLAPFFKLYSVYAYDYKEATVLLQDLQKTNPDLSRFIANQESRPEVGTKLMSLLIAPVQRVPRYRLLLKEVISHTPRTHKDYRILLASLREVENAADHINGLMQDQENMQRMLELQKCLCGGKPRIITPGRKLLKEGALVKVSIRRNKSHSRYFVLFNDMVMYCKIKQSPPSVPNSLKCCCILPLKKCTVEKVLTTGMFKLSCQNETMIFCSASVEEGEAWISSLRRAIRQYQECRQTLRKDSSSRRPLRRPYIRAMSQDDLTPPVKRMKACSKQTPAPEQHVQDSLYPLRSSLKKKEVTPSGKKCGTVTVAKLQYDSDLNPSCSNVTNESVGNITLNATQNWCLQSTQIIRDFISRVRQAVQRRVFRRTSALPMFR